MGRIALACVLLAIASSSVPGCSCTHQSYDRSYPVPSADEVLAHLDKVGALAKSYVAQSTMDYWVGGERVKAKVYVMGERGAKVRFNAINPATDTTARDLACDGQNFTFVDYDNNCQMTGVCDRQAIGQLLRVSMEPDDFLLLVVGSTPIIPQPTGTVRWDASRGAEVVDLVSPDRAWRQTLVLDGRDEKSRWDVLESTVFDADGKVDWKLENKGFRDLKTQDGKTVRVPSASHFSQPKQKADLQVRWDERTINLDLGDDKFVLAAPAIKR
jgi:outer membrane lipoprotein-sorting protein